MKPIHSRYDWIEKYLRDRSTPSAPYCVNTLDAYFVEAYIRETGATFVATTIGAHKCKLLGQDLSMMMRTGRLSRRAVGIDGLRGMGFPSWVYNYRLKN